jgi:hypothetical protein
MTGLVRKATLGLVLCGVLVAGAASANVPDPAQCTLPVRLYLVGKASAFPVGGSINADATNGSFTITVRDLNGALINNSNVAVDFSACADSKICSTQDDPLMTVECAAKTVRKFTVAGVAQFTIRGVGNITGFPLPTTCAKVYADGVFLGSLSVSLYDHLGGGVGATDLAAFLDDFLSLQNPSRSDYVAPFSSIGATDLAKWVDVFLSTGSAVNCSSPAGTCN